ncbi:MAG TPA: class I SAM-dependent methyltransferase, partial [Candidatus Norongarragalinales archaeon]|nr:class I SAM-dependent methyltransferase [Candidatus Norongarragalinales archaeon]
MDINAYWKQQSRTTDQIGEYREDAVIRLVADCLQLTPEKSVLDVGCATGQMLSLLPAGRKVGIDYSEKYIEKAKVNVPDVELHLGEAAQLPFPDESFDAVLSHSTFILFDYAYADRVVAELSRVCKTGGRILVGDVSDMDRYPGGRWACKLRTALL